MKADCHCMPEACPEASVRVQLVQIDVSPARHWRGHGKDVDRSLDDIHHMR